MIVLSSIGCKENNQVAKGTENTCLVPDSKSVQFSFVDYVSKKEIGDFILVMGKHIREMPPEVIVNSYYTIRSDSLGSVLVKKDSLIKWFGGLQDIQVVFLKNGFGFKMFNYGGENCQIFSVRPQRVKKIMWPPEPEISLIDSITINVKINGEGDRQNLAFSKRYPFYQSLLIQKKFIGDPKFPFEIILFPGDTAHVVSKSYSRGNILRKKENHLSFNNADRLTTFFEL